MDAETLLRHAGFVRAIARGLLTSDEAEDVVQDTMVAALERPPRDPSRLRAWLGAVGRRLSLKRRRSDRRRGSRERDAARPEGLASVAEVAGQLEIQRKVVEAVVALDEPYRSTVVHRYFHDRSVDEIARALGVPKKTVESRLTRALAQLRARLDTEHGGRRAWTVALLSLPWPRGGVGGVGGLLVTVKAKGLVAAVIAAALGFGVVGFATLRPDGNGSSSRAEARRVEQGAPGSAPSDPVAVADVDAPPTDAAATASGEPPLPPAPPGTLLGRITCADGRPAAGARVVAHGNLERDGAVRTDAGGRTERLETRTDEQGIYRFERLATGVYQVQAFHEGHAPSEEWGTGHYVSATWGAKISIQLKLGGTVRVVVRDIAGAAMPHVEVELLAGFVLFAGQQPIARAVTDEQGVAALEHLAQGGTLRLRAQGEEHLRRMVGVYDKRTTVVEVVVGSVVAGDVALDDGTPVRDAKVICFGPMDGRTSAAQTEAPVDAAGRYVLRWLEPGQYEVWVEGMGIASGPKRVEFAAAPATALPLRLGRSVVAGSVIHDACDKGPGVVFVDDNGVVLPRQIFARLTSRNRERMHTAHVAANGSFVFHDVAPGEYTLSAWENGGLDAQVDLVVGRDERIEGKDLVFRRSFGEVEIEILDAGGAFTGHVQLYVGSTSIAPPSLGPGRYRFPAPTGRRSITVQWANGSRQTKVDVDVEEGKTAYKAVRLSE